ncbi:uncharacterized protein K452DRAFT_41708 [Aplosporella prunicola CBS 121167]|uniref:DUF2293 domain-containing protein n=1 Tax=Aplosporella prunicola CBS 121167 TaxID=1176127 RepID=A0A6A6B9Y8_9PEZI|nr:uncharacterized protein K452DRAFT_41708 [Aplosporella prunicola CBS 121167]KAF2140846.1 hypothetical protein K452DRAFT_41708 [Aplosporella prunicola CBS 121167]
MERTVPRHAPLPRGYDFVPKGDLYITKNCKTLTLNSGADVYIVHDAKNRRLGIRVPSVIYKEVQAASAETAAARRAATRTRDEKTLSDAQKVLTRLFPRLPPALGAKILAHAFEKHSGRVGRTGTRTPEEKITLAVRAHARHAETPYDELLARGMRREDARARVLETVERTVRRWQGLPVEASPRRLSFRVAEREARGRSATKSAAGKPATGKAGVRKNVKVKRSPKKTVKHKIASKTGRKSWTKTKESTETTPEDTAGMGSSKAAFPTSTTPSARLRAALRRTASVISLSSGSWSNAEASEVSEDASVSEDNGEDDGVFEISDASETPEVPENDTTSDNDGFIGIDDIDSIADSADGAPKDKLADSSKGEEQEVEVIDMSQPDGTVYSLGWLTIRSGQKLGRGWRQRLRT